MKKKTKEQIRQWIKKKNETKERHENMDCKVYELKIDASKLSTEKKNHLNKLFIEAKWQYNYMLSSEDIFKYDYKISVVKIKNKDGEFEDRTISKLGSQMKQGLWQRTKQNIVNLSKSKKKGNNVGRLNFTPRVNSIPLNQYGITYKFNDNGRYFKIQGLNKWIKVYGYKQFPEDAEFANATLVRKPSGYYLKVVCFMSKQKRVMTNESVGIDFGIKSSLTLSNGEKIDLKFPVSDTIKTEHRRLSRKKKGSRNYYKQQRQLDLAYEKQNNQKKDRRNKVVSDLVKRFDVIVVQDESIKGWQSGWFGKQIQESALGGIMSDLKRKSHTLEVVSKYVPTTKGCYVCGSVNKENKLADRTYVCEHCGFTEDRDIHSAKMILRLKVPTECREFKPVEILSSTLEGIEGKIPMQDLSVKQETSAFRQR
jgi:transposase